MSLSISIILFLLLPLSWLLCKVVINYARKKAILDIPNERSSHTSAKPRGGGLAIVVTFLLFTIIMFIIKGISLNLFLAIFGGGLIIAFIGWLDDKNKGISIKIRIIFQLIAAIWVICWLHGLPKLSLGETNINLGYIGYVLSVLGIIWLTNLYNFMDGTDGIAASEAITVGFFAGCLSLLAGANNIAILCFALALSSVGFLIWNWAPAKIFMGDVGSSFLGFIFGVLAIASENNGGPPLVVWVILLGVFLVDSTVTLIRRILMRECWYEAHRTHAYQCATQIGYSHKRVSIILITINFVLVILALVIWYYPVLAIPVLLSAILSLSIIQLIIYFKYRSLQLNSGGLTVTTEEMSIKENN